MTELDILNIISKGGLVAILMVTVYYLHKQYNDSIARFYERETTFYKELASKLDDILDELKNGNKRNQD